LFGIIITIAIAMMLIISSSSFPNMALSKSSSHHNNKRSSNLPLLTNGGISGSGSVSNLNGFQNQSSSTSHLYSAPPPSTYTSGGNNISGAVNSNSNNKVVMIGFDDGFKSQITYAKPILDKYGLKASFFVVCNYVNSGDMRRSYVVKL
jgi:hypothetical protein